jgi:phage tail-like protein
MPADGHANCRFYVELDGLAQAVFTEISGLQVETDVTEYQEGGNNGFVHRLPGRTKIGTITLKRGVTGQNELFKWCQEVLQGKINPKNISVVMYDARGTELMRWNFAKAYPIKWSGPQFSAEGKVAALESLELAHDGLVPS